MARGEGEVRNLRDPEPSAAPTTGTKRVGRLNDKKSRPTGDRESDRSIVARGKDTAPTRAKGLTR